jgi:hypothetical protein
VAKERRHRDDWLSEWNEVQDHRYDPGHWLGRIHPFYRRWAAMGRSVSFGLGLIAIDQRLSAPSGDHLSIFEPASASWP